MQHDFFRSGHDLNLRPNFEHDLLRSYSSIVASQLEEYDAGEVSGVSFLSQMLLPKTFFVKQLFLKFLFLYGCQAADLMSNLRTPQ